MPPLCRLGCLLRGRLSGVSFKRPGGRKFSQLVAHHILGDVHRNELLPVVHGDGVPDELRQDGRTPRPRPDHLLLILLVQRAYLDHQVVIAEWPFFYRTTHSFSRAPLPFLRPVSHNPFFGALVVAGLEPARGLTPRSHWVPATRGLALAAAVRVIHGVHADATIMRPLAHPSLAPRFSERHVFVVRIANLAHRRQAVHVHPPDLA